MGDTFLRRSNGRFAILYFRLKMRQLIIELALHAEPPCQSSNEQQQGSDRSQHVRASALLWRWPLLGIFEVELRIASGRGQTQTTGDTRQAMGGARSRWPRGGAPRPGERGRNRGLASPGLFHGGGPGSNDVRQSGPRRPAAPRRGAAAPRRRAHRSPIRRTTRPAPRDPKSPLTGAHVTPTVPRPF